MRTAVKNIKVGRFVEVFRRGSRQITKGKPTFMVENTVGIISHIPQHRRFCVVQFFNQKTGKPIYKESFFWSAITLIDRPEDFKGRLPERAGV